MRTVSLALMFAFGSCTPAVADDGFVPLFNGKDLAGWEVKENRSQWPDAELWHVTEGGILAGRGGSGWLGTTKEYGDFVLRLEWRIPAGGNSGVFVRVPGVSRGKSPSQTGLEIQILDDNAPQYKGKLKPYQYSGSIYTFVPAEPNVFKGAGEWNAFEISCKGDRVAVTYNGKTVAVGDAAKDPELAKRPKKGFIGLQNHSSPVEFRNVRIRSLDR